MSDNYITAIHLRNFKSFQSLKIDGLNKEINIFIGDNDTGKSTVLLAIDLVLNANPNRIETIGLDRLISQKAVDEFLRRKDRKFADLPEMEIDLYLSEQGRHELDGSHNIQEAGAYGVYLRCRPRDDLRAEIQEIIALEESTFPYEYYLVEVKGFGGETITPYKKPIQHLNIDNTKISNDHASKAYVKAVYSANTQEVERNQHKYGYRRIKDQFSSMHFDILNDRIDDEYKFALKSNNRANLESDLTIAKSGVDIENLGVGAQCFIRTSFALSKKTDIDVVLLEEPENHLSYTNMRKLIRKVKRASQSQTFVATHSSLVCSRLDLRHAILFGGIGSEPIKLADLSQDTAEFFMKAPSSSVLEFVLSERNLLVEGDAEYILMPAFFKRVLSQEMDETGLSVISVGGVSFPRYLDIAKLLGTRTAVITDNDGDPDTHCVDRYQGYADRADIKIFYDPDPERRTFEICVRRDNEAICDELFSRGRRKLTVEEYMLANKSTAAFELAQKKADKVIPPRYIDEALTWIMS